MTEQYNIEEPIDGEPPFPDDPELISPDERDARVNEWYDRHADELDRMIESGMTLEEILNHFE